MRNKYRTIYKLFKWDSPEQLVEETQKLSDDGWRVEITRLYKEGDTGWSIAMKSEEVYLDKNTAEIPLSKIWDFINRHGMKGYQLTPEVEAISNEVHDWHKQTFGEPGDSREGGRE